MKIQGHAASYEWMPFHMVRVARRTAGKALRACSKTSHVAEQRDADAERFKEKRIRATSCALTGHEDWFKVFSAAKRLLYERDRLMNLHDIRLTTRTFPAFVLVSVGLCLAG